MKGNETRFVSFTLSQEVNLGNFASPGPVPFADSVGHATTQHGGELSEKSDPERAEQEEWWSAMPAVSKIIEKLGSTLLFWCKPHQTESLAIEKVCMMS